MSDIVLGKVGRGLATRVPYDAVVEYLEGDGNAYIDSLVRDDSGTFKFSFTVSVHRQYLQFIYASGTNAGGNMNGVEYGIWGNTKFGYWSGSGIYQTSTGVELDRYYSVTVDESTKKISVDGVVSAFEKKTHGRTYFVFAGSCVSSGVESKCYVSDGRLKFFKIEKSDGTIVRDLIPVRVGQVGYMYDRAHPFGGPLGNGLYPNAGDGAFVLGPDVVERNLIPYVTDGLTAMWDGKWNAGIMAHDPGARTWKDLVGVADLVKYGATAPSWGADYLLEDDYWTTTDATVLGALNAGPATLELVACVYGAPHVGCTLFGGDKLQLFGYIMHAGVMMDWRWSGGAGNLGIAPTDANIHYLSSQFIPSPRSRKTYKDGKLFLSDEAGGASLSTVMGVGVGFGSWASFARNAKIYCARVYNRALTPFEITHNYAVDRARFNLP